MLRTFKGLWLEWIFYSFSNFFNIIKWCKTTLRIVLFGIKMSQFAHVLGQSVVRDLGPRLDGMSLDLNWARVTNLGLRIAVSPNGDEFELSILLGIGLVQVETKSCVLFIFFYLSNLLLKFGHMCS